MNTGSHFNRKPRSREFLRKEIRCSENVEHRLSAARQLAEHNGGSDDTLYIVNMALFDPDAQVRVSAKQLLKEIHASEVDTILQVEGSDGKPVEEPWMLPCQEKMLLVSNPGMAEEIADLDELLAENDLEGLQEVLRDPIDPYRRRLSAKALSGFQTEENMELLAKAVLLDPEEEVGQQAYESLYSMLGQQRAEDLLERVGASDLTEDWLFPIDPYAENPIADKPNDSIFGISDYDLFYGLARLYNHEKDPLKKISLLGRMFESRNVRVNEMLAGIVLHEEDPHLVDFARQELESRLGEHAEEFLEMIQSSTSASEDNQEEETDEPEYPQSDLQGQLHSQSPVISEERSPLGLILIAGVAILAIILYFVLR